MKVRNITKLTVRVEGIGPITPGKEIKVPKEIAKDLIKKYGFEEIKKKPEKPQKEVE
jgi:hypothetical protein